MMDRIFSSRDAFRENSIFLNRVVASIAFMLFATLALVARLVYLQVSSHELYSSLARGNQVRISPITPPRGMIFDRNGEPLADNVATYSLEVTPEQAGDLARTLKELSQLLGLTDEEISRFKTQQAVHKSFEPLPLRLGLSEEDIARVALRLPWLSGVEIRKRLVRSYPYGSLTAHVVGYVARINEAELKTLDTAEYQGTFFSGKSGLEKSYEAVLHGRAGYDEYETNVKGRILKRLGTKDALPGADLHLSLDIGLQKIAIDALGEYSGAVVAIEPASGRVLALASTPSYDPNPFIQGIDKTRYAGLQADSERPLYERATKGAYPPGSTVKPFVALAGLDLLNLSPAHKVACPGYYRLPDSSHKYRDWRHSGHGATDMRLAIAQSCDVYFYQLAHQLGIEKMHDFMQEGFGFGQPTGIDLPGEKAGLFPSEDWKMRHRKAPWQAGETVIAGIGQGYVLATPLQMARATAILANHGINVQPRLVDSLKARYPVENPYPRDTSANGKPINPEHWQTVVDAMQDVIHGRRGTAKGIARGLNYHIAGKTGTAQVFTVGQGQNYKSMKITRNMRDHAWFIAFAPAEMPRIAVAVIAEHGGHGGSVAAPVARAVMDQYLRKRP
jgi:penicillin-binding protein 2